MSATLNQPYQFLAAAYCGMIIALAYCLLRLVRYAAHNRKIPTVICDILFFVISMLLCLHTFYYVYDSVLRYYHFLGLFCGFALFYFGPGTLISPCRHCHPR